MIEFEFLYNKIIQIILNLSNCEENIITIMNLLNKFLASFRKDKIRGLNMRLHI